MFDVIAPTPQRARRGGQNPKTGRNPKAGRNPKTGQKPKAGRTPKAEAEPSAAVEARAGADAAVSGQAANFQTELLTGLAPRAEADRKSVGRKPLGGRGRKPGAKRRKARRIFISYRRADSSTVSGRIYDRLKDRFGKRAVVMDVFDIKPGVDFEIFIAETIPRCSVVLLPIGPEWTAPKSGVPRPLFSASDPVRREIEIALASDVRIVPVLVGGARLPPARALPKGLKQLLKRHAVSLREDPHFPDDLARLIEHL